MCCLRLKQSRIWRNSAARSPEGLSTWMFISPSIRILGDAVQNIERRLYISEMKDGFGLGGLYISSIVIENGGLHWNARHSKEDSSGRDKGDKSK